MRSNADKCFKREIKVNRGIIFLTSWSWFEMSPIWNEPPYHGKDIQYLLSAKMSLWPQYVVYNSNNSKRTEYDPNFSHQNEPEYI